MSWVIPESPIWLGKRLDGLCIINILDQNINEFSLYSNIGKGNRDPMYAEKVGNFFFLEEKKVGNLNCLNTFLLHIDLFLLIGKSQKIVYFILTTQLYHGPPN